MSGTSATLWPCPWNANTPSVSSADYGSIARVSQSLIGQVATTSPAPVRHSVYARLPMLSRPEAHRSPVARASRPTPPAPLHWFWPLIRSEKRGLGGARTFAFDGVPSDRRLFGDITTVEGCPSFLRCFVTIYSCDYVAPSAAPGRILGLLGKVDSDALEELPAVSRVRPAHPDPLAISDGSITSSSSKPSSCPLHPPVRRVRGRPVSSEPFPPTRICSTSSRAPSSQYRSRDSSAGPSR